MNKGRLAARRRVLIVLVDMVQGVGELLDALSQGIHLTLIGNAQPGQRLAEPVVEGLFHTVHGFAGMVAHPFLQLADAWGFVLGAAFHLAAGFHQGIEKATALFLGAGEGAQPGQPDLVGVLAQIAGRTAERAQRVATLVHGGSGLVLGDGIAVDLRVLIGRSVVVGHDPLLHQRQGSIGQK